MKPSNLSDDITPTGRLHFMTYGAALTLTRTAAARTTIVGGMFTMDDTQPNAGTGDDPLHGADQWPGPAHGSGAHSRRPLRTMTIPSRLRALSTALLLALVSGLQAQAVLTGTVHGQDVDFPLAGASIVEKGTLNGTITDASGSFRLAITRDFPVTLVVAYVGYASQDVPVSNATTPLRFTLLPASKELGEVVITARRRRESAQEVPIAISVIGGTLVQDAGAFNVNRLKELVPTVQLYTSNPRNTTLNIRGLGSTFGLTNDGLDPGVGFYVDGVYYARPAATTLDFIDIERIEVLRGPQGTLFGKNTTAGAFNITTGKPSFTPGGAFELSYGNYGFIQAKSSVTGGLGKKFAARLSFSGTQRDGLLYNTATEKPVNDLNNTGVRGQLLFKPKEGVEITLAADASRQRPDGYAQVLAGVMRTQRAEYRQFERIIADLGYSITPRPFDREIDHDTPWRSGNDLGGVSLNADIRLGPGTLTSTTAWRYWNWDPSNDRDFTGLQGLRLSQAPSLHDQWSQEVRWAGDVSSRLSGVVGAYLLGQDLRSDPYHTEEAGRDQWRFSQSSTSPLWRTPGLLEGYGTRTRNRLESFSGAVFANLDWAISDRLHVLPGIRFNHDEKKVEFERTVSGGLETNDPDLIALMNSVYNAQAFNAEVDEQNFSGQLTVAYRFSQRINAFATWSSSFKPVGLNLGGLPRESGRTMIELARVEPEYVAHIEAGLKTSPSPNSTLNIVFHNTDIDNYQTVVQTPDLAVNRGYLANAEKVNVFGVELDASVRAGERFSVYGAVAYTDGRYVKFTNAPLPLEETGGPSPFKDISGGRLPGISEWAGSLGAEVATGRLQFLGQAGSFFLALEGFYRSSFSSSPSPSQYLNIDGYALLNGRVGFRATNGLSIFVWGRNLLDKDYFEQLLVAGGNAGHYAGVLGDQRTYGVTLRHNF